jgi:hypothetical protein
VELKHKIETIYSVDSSDFEEFVQEKLNHRYDFVQASECANDSNHRYKVNEEIKDYSLREAEKFIEEGWPGGWFNAGDVLNALLLKGHIEPGTYIISVCW